MSCVFCKIVAGDIPCDKVFEDENHIAFLDINPMQKGHVLVLPKKHIGYFFDMGEDQFAHLNLLSQAIAKKIKNATQCKRVCLLVEGYMIDHVHIHLIPTNEASEFDLGSHVECTKEEFLELSEKIRNS